MESRVKANERTIVQDREAAFAVRAFLRVALGVVARRAVDKRTLRRGEKTYSLRERLQRRGGRRARVFVRTVVGIDPVFFCDGFRRVRHDDARRRHRHIERLVHFGELVAALLGRALKAEVGLAGRRTRLKDGVGCLGEGVQPADRAGVAAADDRVRTVELHGAARRDRRLRVGGSRP